METGYAPPTEARFASEFLSGKGEGPRTSVGPGYVPPTLGTGYVPSTEVWFGLSSCLGKRENSRTSAVPGFVRALAARRGLVCI